MADWLVFLTVALGVFVAVLYPVLYGYIKNEFPPRGKPGLPPWLKKYAALFAFSLVTALIVLAAYKSTNPGTQIGFWAALLMGFGWEATVEKLIPLKISGAQQKLPPGGVITETVPKNKRVEPS